MITCGISRWLKNGFVILLSTMVVTYAYAQQSTFSIEVDKSTIRIGEPIIIKCKASIPASEPVRFFSIDTIPHFEMLEKGIIDTNGTGTGTSLTQIIKITSFDSGRWAIPPQFMGTKKVTDSIILHVGYSAFNSNQPYHDVDDIIEATQKKSVSWWYYAIPILVVGTIIFAVRRRKKKEVTPVQKIALSNYDQAINSLHALQRKSLPPKQFYTELIDILNIYVKEKSHAAGIEVLPFSIITYLEKTSLSESDLNELKQVVMLSDFVKFAKYNPAADEQKHSYTVVRNAIQSIEQVV